jgi:hypothetical protein|tara:strand:+ start:451 stop:648 length:198 start_codon:yes stop_codon:yes gene_type:complete
MLERLLDKLHSAIVELDVVPMSALKRDLLRSTNRALSEVGGLRLSSLDEVGPVRRAVALLEDEVV